jgi:subtilisin family serine protease
LINEVRELNQPNISAQTRTSVKAESGDNSDALAAGSDMFTPSLLRSNFVSEFIIIPPKNMIKDPTRTPELRTPSGSDSEVQVKETLPVVNGFVVEMDYESAIDFREMGYIVASDHKIQMLFDPDEKLIVNGQIDVDRITEDDETRSEMLKNNEEITLYIRPPLEGPRFDTPLTRKYTGKDLSIAIIDSGIHPHHDFINPTNRIVDFVDFVNGKTEPYDDRGHGTHVAGDAAGNGLLSDGLYKAPASEANLIGLKVLSGEGKGKSSDVIKAIQWCIENKEKHNIKVINMSLGFTAQVDYDDDPINIAIRKAREEGIVVVASAGNRGPNPGTITTPGDCWSTISVGAADDRNTLDKSDDIMTNFSSRGPAAGGVMKPDLVAPGEGIISTLAPGSDNETKAKEYGKIMKAMYELFHKSDEEIISVPKEYLESIGLGEKTIERWYESPRSARLEAKRLFEATQRRQLHGEHYVSTPGTSMASPIVGGTAICMLDANPDLTPGQVMMILVRTADKLPGGEPEHAQGGGMVNPHNAIQMALDVKDGKITIEEPDPALLDSWQIIHHGEDSFEIKKAG